jgi:hypothetical protein
MRHRPRLAAIRAASWFSPGSGSPTYALTHWRDQPIGDARPRDRTSIVKDPVYVEIQAKLEELLSSDHAAVA